MFNTRPHYTPPVNQPVLRSAESLGPQPVLLHHSPALTATVLITKHRQVHRKPHAEPSHAEPTRNHHTQNPPRTTITRTHPEQPHPEPTQSHWRVEAGCRCGSSLIDTQNTKTVRGGRVEGQ